MIERVLPGCCSNVLLLGKDEVSLFPKMTSEAGAYSLFVCLFVRLSPWILGLLGRCVSVVDFCFVASGVKKKKKKKSEMSVWSLYVFLFFSCWFVFFFLLYIEPHLLNSTSQRVVFLSQRIMNVPVADAALKNIFTHWGIQTRWHIIVLLIINVQKMWTEVHYLKKVNRKTEQ